MTQAKKTKVQQPVTDLRAEFLKLPQKEQAYVGHFFAMHNAAHEFYDLLSEAGKKYVNYCIQLSQEADKINKAN